MIQNARVIFLALCCILFMDAVSAAGLPYDPQKTYKKLARVTYPDQSGKRVKWVAMYWVDRGMLPTEGQGPWAVAIAPITCTSEGVVDWGGQEYPHANTRVCYKGKVYQNQWWANSADKPDAKGGPWKELKLPPAIPPGPPPYSQVVPCNRTFTPAEADLRFQQRQDIEFVKVKAGINQYTLTQWQAANALDCQPPVDLKNAANNQANVQTIMAAFPEATWNEFMHYTLNTVATSSANNENNKKLIEQDWQSIYVEGGGGPILKSTLSYENFLKVAARFPHFCGDQDIYLPSTGNQNLIDSCKREIAAILGHAAQETGGHLPSPPNADPENRQIISATRELGYYSTDFEPITEKDTCHKSYGNNLELLHKYQICYYGRGLTQLTHPYNYQAFSSAMLNDPEYLLKYPDQVARDGYLILASALWFHMSPQPPKPSKHAVMTRLYRPGVTDNAGNTRSVPVASYQDAAKSIQIGIDDNGALVDPFKFTVSLINGAFECFLGKPTSDMDELLRKKSHNRFEYYLATLSDLIGSALKIPSERGYDDSTVCDLPHGPLTAYSWNDLKKGPFNAKSSYSGFDQAIGADRPFLGQQIPFYVEGHSCAVTSLQTSKTLPIVSPDVYPKACIKK